MVGVLGISWTTQTTQSVHEWRQGFEGKRMARQETAKESVRIKLAINLGLARYPQFYGTRSIARGAEKDDINVTVINKP